MSKQVTAAELEDGAPFEAARAIGRSLEDRLSSEEAMKKTHSDLEEMVSKAGTEWMRAMMAEHLELRARAEARLGEVRDAKGDEHRRTRESERHLETIFGRVAVPRLAYQKPGAADLHPMDASLNLPKEVFSHGIRKMVARDAVRMSFEDVVDQVEERTGASIAKRQVEELTVRAAQDFEAFYERKAEEQASSQDLLVLSTDGKGIAMRHEDLREGTRRAAEAKVKTLETRLSPGEKRQRKRMAQVAAVYTIPPFVRSAADVIHTMRDKAKVDAKRPRPVHKRVFASVEKTQARVIAEMFDEAERRDPEHARRWVALVDGERNQLRSVRAEARKRGVELTIVVDVVHVLEYLWAAARALFEGTNADVEGWVSQRLLALMSGRSGGDVSRTIRWWEKRAKGLTKERKAAVTKTCRYLSNRSRATCLRYADALRDGLPIATGVIEGACRYLVGDRMNRSGARWSLTGAEAVLRLRAIVASDDFEAYWAFHLEREHERNHAVRYAGQEVPNPLPPKRRGRAPLRRVK